MSEKCARCGKSLPNTWTMTIGGPPGSKADDIGWHWINAAPHAAANFGPPNMVAVCNKCDPPPVFIPRARYEALMGANERLREAAYRLMYYAEHLQMCCSNTWDPKGCDCGLNAAIDKYNAALRSAGIEEMKTS